MGIRITSVSTPWGGLGWEFTEKDAEVARRVVARLENKRLLFGLRMFEDQRYCIESAIHARHELTEEIGRSISDELRTSLRAMRAAFRRFVENGGPDGSLYYPQGSLDPFSLALGELRSNVGAQIQAIAFHYKIEVEEDLASIMPPLPTLDDEILGD